MLELEYIIWLYFLQNYDDINVCMLCQARS
jgi:hypothetical protein